MKLINYLIVETALCDENFECSRDLAIDTGEYLCTNSLHAIAAPWSNCSSYIAVQYMNLPLLYIIFCNKIAYFSVTVHKVADYERTCE